MECLEITKLSHVSGKLERSIKTPIYLVGATPRQVTRKKQTTSDMRFQIKPVDSKALHLSESDSQSYWMNSNLALILIYLITKAESLMY